MKPFREDSKNELARHIKDGTKVISLRYGVGTIIGVSKMHDGIDDFLEVEYIKDGEKKFFCLCHINDVRLISTEEEIKLSLRSMTEKLGNKSNFSKLIDPRGKSRDITTQTIVQRIVALLRKDSLRSLEEEQLEKLIESLVVEVGEAFVIDQSSAREIVKSHM